MVKKNSSLWWIVDYRRFNAITVGNSYPAPSLDVVISQVKLTAAVSSNLNCSKAYLFMSMVEDSRDPTSFTMPFGLFQFGKTPFGLLNA